MGKRLHILIIFVLSGIVSHAQDTIRELGTIRVAKEMETDVCNPATAYTQLGGLSTFKRIEMSPVLRIDMWTTETAAADVSKRPSLFALVFEGFRSISGLRTGVGIVYGITHDPSVGFTALNSYPLLFFANNNGLRNAFRVAIEGSYILNRTSQQFLLKPGLDFRVPFNSGTHLRFGAGYVKTFNSKGDGIEELPEGIQVSIALVLGRYTR